MFVLLLKEHMQSNIKMVEVLFYVLEGTWSLPREIHLMFYFTFPTEEKVNFH